MKRITSAIIIASLFAFTACTQYMFIPVAGAGDTPEHVHVWDEGKVLQNATCVDDGIIEYTCELCGAVRTDAIEAYGHNFVSGTCTICGNSEAVVEAAEARIGLQYYPDLKSAVEAAALRPAPERVIEITKDFVNNYNAHSIEINGSITINANGADFGNKDLAIYTYNNSWANPEQGDILIAVNDARNLYLWGQPDNIIEGDTVLNIELSNCHNTGTSSTQITGSGRMVYLTGTEGITNIAAANCSVKTSESPFYTNNPGTILFRDCTFSDTSAPLNFNMKAPGKKSITIDGCLFEGCGTDEDDAYGLAQYSAPIRAVVTADDAECTLNVKNTAISNSIGKNGDVLLCVRGGNYYGVTAYFEDNRTDIKVYGDLENPVTVKAGTNAEVSSEDNAI